MGTAGQNTNNPASIENRHAQNQNKLQIVLPLIDSFYLCLIFGVNAFLQTSYIENPSDPSDAHLTCQVSTWLEHTKPSSDQTAA